MRFPKLLALAALVIGGCLSIAGAPASAAPVGSALPAATAASGPAESYMQYRRYRHRYYAPRRAYRRAYRPYRYYRPRYYRPRVVCRIRYTPWGPRRVCFRRW
jgi:hypothetical protein